uniref:WD40/YVTN/BNR-like repeat-containing protein n=2 Tax=Roseivirga sp. TaxID=1964215 RepID=UPI0040485F44
MKIAVGTDKGLLIYEKVNDSWQLNDIHFLGMPIGAFHEDVSQNWWVAINHKHWGPKIYRSDNRGETFKEVNSPKFNTNSAYSLKSVWTIQSRIVNNELQLFIGTEPAALFNSTDLGLSWIEMDGLSKHPSRNTWQGGGKGSNSPFLHAILFNKEGVDHIMVGISCAGVFQTFNGGNSWQPTNEGLKAFFLPNSESEVGHDPHTIRQSRKNANVLWQQNHCGIYRSEDYGNTWKDITDKNNEAVYGFAMVIAEDNDQEAWVIPAESDNMRIPTNQRLAVYYTHNAGNDWKALTQGLPNPSFDLVLRDAMDLRDEHIAFGTNNGNLYVSENKGKQWLTLSQNLSAVRNIKFINP